MINLKCSNEIKPDSEEYKIFKILENFTIQYNLLTSSNIKAKLEKDYILNFEESSMDNYGNYFWNIQSNILFYKNNEEGLFNYLKSMFKERLFNDLLNKDKDIVEDVQYIRSLFNLVENFNSNILLPNYNQQFKIFQSEISTNFKTSFSSWLTQ